MLVNINNNHHEQTSHNSYSTSKGSTTDDISNTAAIPNVSYEQLHVCNVCTVHSYIMHKRYVNST